MADTLALTRDEMIAALVEAYIPHYEQYERFDLVAKDVIRDDKPEVYRHIVARANELSVFMDGYQAAAEVLGISRSEFLTAVSLYGKGGENP